jgi:catechol 2,3-dioxygenase-like lactoylglutathione lyase family enzyme
MRHFCAFSPVPSHQAGLDFYVGVLGFSVIKDHRINAHKRWLVIAPEAECTTNIILAKAAEGGTNKRHKQTDRRPGRLFSTQR